jgi:hypothetical protein
MYFMGLFFVWGDAAERDESQEREGAEEVPRG